MLVQTLFAIMREHKSKCLDIRRPITLAIGLPPLHMPRLKDAYVDYFKEHFKNGLTFNYCGVSSTITLSDRIFVFPQAYAAVKAFSPRHDPYKKDSLIVPDEFVKKICKGSFFAIDVGGFTVDFVYFENGKPVFNEWTGSRELGMNRMAEQIINSIMMEFGITLERSNVEDIILGKMDGLDENIIKSVEERAKDWADRIIRDIRTFGVDLRILPCLFLGNGAVLLEKYLKESPILGKYHFLDRKDAGQANAIGYYYLAETLLNKSEAGR